MTVQGPVKKQQPGACLADGSCRSFESLEVCVRRSPEFVLRFSVLASGTAVARRQRMSACTCAAQVTFRPNQEKKYMIKVPCNCTVVGMDDEPTAKYRTSLTVVGEGVLGGLTMEPAVLDFSTVRIGASESRQVRGSGRLHACVQRTERVPPTPSAFMAATGRPLVSVRLGIAPTGPDTGGVECWKMLVAPVEGAPTHRSRVFGAMGFVFRPCASTDGRVQDGKGGCVQQQIFFVEIFLVGRFFVGIFFCWKSRTRRAVCCLDPWWQNPNANI